MKLSFVTIATLAATSPVTAWYVTFYDNTNFCKVDDKTEYQILEGDQFDCNTFGASMDGVDCVHFVEGGRNRKGCKGLFKAHSARPKLDTNSYCTFYPAPDCNELSISKNPGQCGSILEGLNPDYIMSFRCQNSE
ncbi:hypothetical protein FVER14953_12354 [Fusarium verticillioides]|nr:hypothetical protein FVER14953_12354 [Fusarium verticillioides]